MMMNNNIKNQITSFDEIKDRYDHFIFDCDGVIWREKEIISNAVEEIKILQKTGKSVYFLTNSNRLSRTDLKNKLKDKCGLDVDENFAYGSSYIVAKYISDNYPHIKHIYLIGKEGLENELAQHGFMVYGGPNDKLIKTIHNFSNDKADEIEVNENIQACVIGYDDHFNYFKICYASEVIHKTGMFFGLNYDNKVRFGKDRFLPATYTFISCLETCTDKKAEIVTKPDPKSLDIIMKDHNIQDKKRILMIGDNLKTDIPFAVNCGIDALLVLTGVTTEEDLNGDIFNQLCQRSETNSKIIVLKSF
jgi:phosphoglycolate/pyridoxal phosphate phosphatase family enzyme